MLKYISGEILIILHKWVLKKYEMPKLTQ